MQCTTATIAANVEAVAVAARRPVDPSDDIAPAAVMDTPDTPTIATLVDLFNRRDDLRRDDRPMGRRRHAEERRRHGQAPRRQPRAARRSGCQATVTSTPSGSRRALLPAEAEPFSDEDFAAHPQLTKGYIGPGALGEARAMRYLLDPRVVAGTAWITGADAPGKHVMNLVAGRDFTADGTIDVADDPRRRPVPALRRRGAHRPRASRSATSSSSDAATPRRST